MTTVEQALLSFLRASITDSIDCCSTYRPLTEAEWVVLTEIAASQGVVGLVFSQIEKLPHELLPPMDQLMDMLGQEEYQKSHYEVQVTTAQMFAHALRVGISQ